jgi:hypothetical protein
MIQKTIPLKAVKDALMLAIVRSKRADMHLGRFAAFTQYPIHNIGCREARRGHAPYPHMPMHFGFMCRGELDGLLFRVRCEHGLAGVRKIWGAGLRTLQAEFAQGVMR